MMLKTTLPLGILPVCKPKGKTSFSLVSVLRRLTRVKTIGHAGTLDPFADGVMVLLIGKDYTRLSDRFLNAEKEYVAKVRLGISTDTYDTEGVVTGTSEEVPEVEAVQEALKAFQGTFLQVPPMFSAKKVGGKKLYELARKGIEIERQAASVTATVTLLEYTYPMLRLHLICSKGTYVRSIAHELGAALGCGAHLSALTRSRSGSFRLEDCCNGAELETDGYDWQRYIHQHMPTSA